MGIYALEDRMKSNWVDNLVLAIIIIGCINWGLIGFFNFDLVKAIFGNMTLITRIIYAIVGIAGLYAISYFSRFLNE